MAIRLVKLMGGPFDGETVAISDQEESFRVTSDNGSFEAEYWYPEYQPDYAVFEPWVEPTQNA
jgi:hypothetical protein